MEPTANKPPIAMTIKQLFAQLAKQAEHWSEREKAEFKKAWLDSLADFKKRTEEIRFENWKRS